MVFQINGNSYLHTAYSNASDGSVDFSITENDDATYIGQYNSSSADESTNPDDYIWTEVDENADQEYPIDDTEETEEYDDELVDQLDRSDADSTLATGGAQATGDAKIQTYHQEEEPNPDEYVFNVGDLWYDTNDGNHLYRWDGTAWIDAQDAKIGTKATVYYQATEPTGGTYQINDVWFDTANGGKMSYWNGSAWTVLTFGKDAITAGSITAEKLYVDQALINAIIASSISAQAIDITASGDAGVAIIKTKINVDGEYELDIAAGVGTGQAHMIVSPGLINIYGTKLRISVDNLEFDVPYTTNTYTTFTGGVLSGGSIVVCTKAGSCQVFGYLKPSASVTDFTQVLDAVKVPAPQHGANITPTVPSWYSKDDDPARVRVQATGGLAIQGGAANREYNFSITYPIAVDD